MPGIRLRHPELRSTLLLLVDPERPYIPPYLCSACNVAHTAKTYHLYLDHQGTVIVSTGVLAGLRRIPGMGGLQVENVVADPPNQTVHIGGALSR